MSKTLELPTDATSEVRTALSLLEQADKLFAELKLDAEEPEEVGSDESEELHRSSSC